MTAPSITIFGAGATGVARAATLGQAGAKITLAARASALAELRGGEIRVTGALGEHAVPQGTVAFEDSAEAHSAQDCDGIVIATKTYDVEGAARALLPALRANKKNPWLLLLQNGWGSAEEARAIMPEGTAIYSSSLMTGLERRGLLHVHINAHVNPVAVGSLFGDGPEKIVALFETVAHGFWPFKWNADIARVMLTKLVFNACLNPLGALIGCTYGEVVANKDSRALLTAIADEAVKSIAAAQRISLFASSEDYVTRDLIPLRIEKAAAHRPSMLQDLEAGRRTEIGYMNGAIAAMGRAQSIATPANDAIIHLIRVREAVRK